MPLSHRSRAPFWKPSRYRTSELRQVTGGQEPVFNELVECAALVCGTPIALVLFSDGQKLFVKASVGTDIKTLPLGPEALDIMSHSDVRVASGIASRVPLFIDQFPDLRSYAGIRIEEKIGESIGLLCVLDNKEREFDSVQIKALTLLASQCAKVAEIRQRLGDMLWDQKESDRLFEIAGIATWRTEVGSDSIYGSPAFNRRYGVEVEVGGPISRAHVYSMLHPDDAPGVRSAMSVAVSAGTPYETEFRISDPKGGWLWQLARGFSDFDEQGKLCGMAGILVDVTQHKRAEIALETSRRQLQTIVDSVPALIAFWDRDYRIQISNRTYLDWFGFRAEEIRGKQFREIFGDELFEANLPQMEAVLSGEPQQFERTLERPLGTIRHFQVSYVPYRDGGNVLGFFSLVTDITARKNAEESLALTANKMSYLALHDALTGLPNRLLLEDRLTLTLARSKRTKEHFAVFFLDLDHFKDINDRLGHAAGDELLRKIAQRLVSVVREDDTVCRQGGDEFIILMPHIESDEQAVSLAERVLRAVRVPYEVRLGSAESYVTATFSLGIAVYPDDGTTHEQLVQRADEAMYVAKKAGRNRFHRLPSL